jgi:hypothetical protein
VAIDKIYDQITENYYKFAVDIVARAVKDWWKYCLLDDGYDQKYRLTQEMRDRFNFFVTKRAYRLNGF